MRFASFGRERDKEFIRQYTLDEGSKDMLLRMTDAVHDLKDGNGSVEQFIDCVRDVVASTSSGMQEHGLLLLARVSRYHPQCLVIWRELASHRMWQHRLAVASRLYWHVPEDLSDSLFAVLRHDKSKRVREIARSHYEYRPNEQGEIVFNGTDDDRTYDADRFDERVRRGEVKIVQLVSKMGSGA
jgi:hypothetical protein